MIGIDSLVSSLVGGEKALRRGSNEGRTGSKNWAKMERGTEECVHVIMCI